jgi:hypothetical protein
MTNGGRADHERAIGNRLCQVWILFGMGQYFRSIHSRAGLPKCNFIGVHYPQSPESEIAHGASGRSNIEGISDAHKNDSNGVGGHRIRLHGGRLRRVKSTKGQSIEYGCV